MPNKIFIRPLFQSEETQKTSSGLDGKPKGTSTAQNKNQVAIEGDDVMVFPLTEDINFVTESELQSWSDMVPGLDMLNTLQAAVVGMSGSISGGVLDLQNLIDAPRWSKTNPIQFTVSLGFYLIDDPYENIYKPIKKLIGLTILSRSKNGRIVPPGIFLPAMAALKDKASPTNLQNTAKLISVKIPGIISMPVAMLKSANAVFSKHITEKGFPLWATLEVTIVGLRPAFEEDFNGEKG